MKPERRKLIAETVNAVFLEVGQDVDSEDVLDAVHCMIGPLTGEDETCAMHFIRQINKGEQDE